MLLPIMKKITLPVLAFCMMAGASAQQQNQPAAGFPNRIVKIVVPFAPGGPADGLARPLAEELSKRLGQQVIIENKPGANTAIASRYVATSAADGYTLLFASDAGMSLAPATQKSLPYDPAKDFVGVSMVAQLTQVLFVNSEVPARSLQELIQMAKKNPQALSYASIGNGSQTHVATEALKRISKIEMVHVPYNGAAPALNDVLGNRVQVMISSVAGPLPHIKAGKLRALAFAGPNRSATLPNVPTFAEAGLPDFESRGWFGLVAPAQTPPEVIKILSKHVWGIAQSDSYRTKIVEARGFDLAQVTPAEFPEFLSRDRVKWATLVEQQDDLKK
jgi:tripartite-type tricarboxylate transporter receptor subunit TctC